MAKTHTNKKYNSWNSSPYAVYQKRYKLIVADFLRA
jgi:hypothetical protein